MKNVLVSLLLLFLLASCGGDDDKNKAAVTACQDLADAVATRLVECAEQRNGVALQPEERKAAYQASYNSFVQEAVGGECDAIKSVRDSESLYDECLPALQNSVTCDNVLAGNLPAVCQKQLIRPETSDEIDPF